MKLKDKTICPEKLPEPKDDNIEEIVNDLLIEREKFFDEFEQYYELGDDSFGGVILIQ